MDIQPDPRRSTANVVAAHSPVSRPGTDAAGLGALAILNKGPVNKGPEG
ncbi:MAG: hypothetical protein QNK42_06250 [Pseudodonghicola sp.]|nr:hypothetical protein [Pseudodonghicola sp.]